MPTPPAPISIFPMCLPQTAIVDENFHIALVQIIPISHCRIRARHVAEKDNPPGARRDFRQSSREIAKNSGGAYTVIRGSPQSQGARIRISTLSARASNFSMRLARARTRPTLNERARCIAGVRNNEERDFRSEDARFWR